MYQVGEFANDGVDATDVSIDVGSGNQIVNNNNRSYPKPTLLREVNKYVSERVDKNMAMGELNHPASADVDLERACHMVTELTQDC